MDTKLSLIPAVNKEGYSLVIFRGAVDDKVITKQMTKESTGEVYDSSYIQLTFDIYTKKGRGYLKTSVFVREKESANSEATHELLDVLGLNHLSSVTLIPHLTEEQMLMNEDASSFTLAPGDSDLEAFLNDDESEEIQSTFIDEVLDLCRQLKGKRYYCKLEISYDEKDGRTYTRYSIIPSSLKLAQA